jgi:hypothetical protein
MMSERARAERLETFLGAHHLQPEQLVADVAEPFGRPLLVVATGSIVQGFGNPQSDLDIYAIVEHDVRQLPIPSFASRFLVHNAFFGVGDVETWVGAIRDCPWPPVGHVTQQCWGARRIALGYCTNFGCGLMLDARDGWSDWLRPFAEPWLADAIVRWWRIESLRRRIAGRWLADAKPLVAAQRQFEAVLALLESRAAAADQLFFGPKWISEKLRMIGDHHGLEALHEIMRLPATDEEARGYSTRCEDLLTRFSGDDAADGLGAQVWYLSDVQVRRLDGRALVSRWNLSAVELRQPSVPDSQELFWEGDLDTLPPAAVMTLLNGGMAWLSIVSTS